MTTSEQSEPTEPVVSTPRKVRLIATGFDATIFITPAQESEVVALIAKIIMSSVAPGPL
jgi:hypothetical protein